MNIGSKIKSLRISKMMTQSELAGSQITRNMLSRIETGSALPSLPTMIYLAGRLGVPAGYILADEGNEFHYRKMNELPNIKRAYEAGDWLICRDLCCSLGNGDDEIAYIMLMSSFNAAKDAFRAGQLHIAGELFNDACAESEKTIYSPTLVKAVSAVYLDYMHTISPSLYSDEESTDELFGYDSLSDSFCRYCAAIRALSLNDKHCIPVDPVAYSESVTSEERPYTLHIKARLLMRKNEYREGYQILKNILSGATDIPAPMIYFIFSDLEICCREMSDYRGAYEYSGDKMGMIERFLR